MAQLLRDIRADRLLLEYDDARSGSFAPLRHVPDDKHVVLGLVGTKTPETPTTESLLGRLENAARTVSRDRLAVSPQCGFSTSIIGNRITPEDQRCKLERVVDVAREFWAAV